MNTSTSMLQVSNWLRAREAAMTRILRRFVRAESPSLDKAAVDRFGAIVAAEWRTRGASVAVVRQRERGNHLRVEWNPSGKKAAGKTLVLGHLDTVYGLGTLAKMPLRTSRGRIYGPGVFDMKAGLVMALFAVDALNAAAHFPQRRVVFLWTSDEEIGSETSRALIEREALQSDAVLVLEPALGPHGLLKTGRKGVGEIEITATGRAAHAGLNPEDGINAIEEISLQIAGMSRWNLPSRGITVSAGLIDGGTRVNVIPEKARVVVDVRATRAEDMLTLDGKFHSLRPILRGAKLEIRGGFKRPPMERNVSAALFAKAQALAKEMGFALGEACVGGGSDGNFTAAIGVPTLDGLGAVGEGAHSPDENIMIRSLPERAALVAGLLARI